MFCSTRQSCYTRADTGLTFVRPQDILAAAVPAASPSLTWDAAASEAKEDPVQTQTQHKKVNFCTFPVYMLATPCGAD